MAQREAPGRLTIALAVCLALLPPLGAVRGAALVPVINTTVVPANPNIVVFYIDDAAPHDGRLWNDPGRTPNIYEHIIAQGLDFDHAIGEDPLCCPARGNLLTGLHTHNNRVILNRASQFDPSVHIGRAMMDAGYASMYIGKYLNNNVELTSEQWAEHDAGWTQLDVIKGINGSFYNYMLHTKTAEFRVKGLHSTQMVADRTVARLRETPADTPVFAVLSIYNMHGPNTPMAQDIGDPRCADMPPWKPPNYNEADVTDKPSGIRALPLQPYPDGWPMVTYCEEMLGVDRAVGQVVDELEAEGRLDNTLLVFTADNGIAWGAHRLGQQKIWPYATPVPLYMSWPAGWGTDPRTIDEIVSNIDLAPTFCDLAAGCTLGPFARGSAGPDGVSLAPLIEGDVTDLGRDAVLEESYVPGSMSWSGLRTTALYDATHRWHYIEYTNGERELYDLMTDPWELDNVAADAGQAVVVAALGQRLAELRLEGIGPGTGTITIVQDTLPDSASDYSFGGDLGSFSLDDDGDPTLPNIGTFADLPSGAWTITRPAVAHLISSEILCDGVGVFDLGAGKLTVYLHPGEEITCTFVDALRQPDASIAFNRTGPYRTDNYYTATPTRKQTRRRTRVTVGATYDYWVRLQNDSLASDSLTVSAQTTGPSSVQVVYIIKGIDVTAEVTAGTYAASLAEGGILDLDLRLTMGPGTPRGAPFKVVLYATSASDPTRVDVVRAVAVR